MNAPDLSLLADNSIALADGFARRIGALDPNGAGALSYLLFEKGYCRHLMAIGFSDGMARRADILDFLGYGSSRLAASI